MSGKGKWSMKLAEILRKKLQTGEIPLNITSMEGITPYLREPFDGLTQKNFWGKYDQARKGLQAFIENVNTSTSRAGVGSSSSGMADPSVDLIRTPLPKNLRRSRETSELEDERPAVEQSQLPALSCVTYASEDDTQIFASQMALPAGVSDYTIEVTSGNIIIVRIPWPQSLRKFPPDLPNSSSTKVLMNQRWVEEARSQGRKSPETIIRITTPFEIDSSSLQHRPVIESGVTVGLAIQAISREDVEQRSAKKKFKTSHGSQTQRPSTSARQAATHDDDSS